MNTPSVSQPLVHWPGLESKRPGMEMGHRMGHSVRPVEAVPGKMDPGPGAMDVPGMTDGPTDGDAILSATGIAAIPWPQYLGRNTLAAILWPDRTRQPCLARLARLARRPSTADRLDTNRRIHLTVSRLSTRVFSPPKFLHDEFWPHPDAQHFGRHAGTFHFRFADFNGVALRYCEDPVKGDLFTLGNVAEVNINFLSLFDSKLSTAVVNDRVHILIPLSWIPLSGDTVSTLSQLLIRAPQYSHDSTAFPAPMEFSATKLPRVSPGLGTPG